MKNEYVPYASSLVHFSGIALSTVFNFIITVMEIIHFYQCSLSTLGILWCSIKCEINIFQYLLLLHLFLGFLICIFLEKLLYSYSSGSFFSYKNNF